MRDLKVRRLPFHFDEDIAFDWNSGNPAIGNVVNYAGMIAPAFERYFVRLTREAIQHIDDPEVKRNAKLFCAQERTHSRHHRDHMNVLLRRYPGLEEAQQKVEASYERLYEEHDLVFHASYQVILEDWFGPLAILFVENREKFFGQSDARIASFALWHFLEEFEHRSSAHAIYKAIVGSHWPRVKHIPDVIRHIIEVRRYVLDGFLEHVPPEDNPSRASLAGFLDGVSWRDRLLLGARILAAVMPGYDPASLGEPEWATNWFREEAEGCDMTLYFPAA